MAPRPFSPDCDPPDEPWAQDPDAWRAAGDGACVDNPPASSGGWPQLDAAPVYWMWLERLEQDRGLER